MPHQRLSSPGSLLHAPAAPCQPVRADTVQLHPPGEQRIPGAGIQPGMGLGGDREEEERKGDPSSLTMGL